MEPEEAWVCPDCDPNEDFPNGTCSACATAGVFRSRALTQKVALPVLTDRELSEVGVEEESAETIIEICKARRFGWHAQNFLDGTTPMERVAGELGDLIGSIEFFIETHPEIEVYLDVLQSRAENKKAKLQHFNNLATRDTPFIPTTYEN